MPSAQRWFNRSARLAKTKSPVINPANHVRAGDVPIGEVCYQSCGCKMVRETDNYDYLTVRLKYEQVHCQNHAGRDGLIETYVEPCRVYYAPFVQMLMDSF
jgi:hypothetical protein